jgi:hypothetical protein
MASILEDLDFCIDQLAACKLELAKGTVNSRAVAGSVMESARTILRQLCTRLSDGECEMCGADIEPDGLCGMSHPRQVS